MEHTFLEPIDETVEVGDAVSYISEIGIRHGNVINSKSLEDKNYPIRCIFDYTEYTFSKKGKFCLHDGFPSLFKGHIPQDAKIKLIY